MKHIVSEFFQEKAGIRRAGIPAKPSRLLEILTSGKVLSCVSCGAFTQMTKKKKDKCHKCSSELFDMNKFTKYYLVPSKWIRATYTMHAVSPLDGICRTQKPVIDITLPLNINMDLRSIAVCSEITKMVKVHLGVATDLLNTVYCQACGSRVVSWVYQITGSLLSAIQEGTIPLDRLYNRKEGVKLLSYEQRAAVEGVAVEDILPKEDVPVKKKKTAARMVPLPEFPVQFMIRDLAQWADMPRPVFQQPPLPGRLVMNNLRVYGEYAPDIEEELRIWRDENGDEV